MGAGERRWLVFELLLPFLLSILLDSPSFGHDGSCIETKELAKNAVNATNCEASKHTDECCHAKIDVDCLHQMISRVSNASCNLRTYLKADCQRVG